MTDVTFDFASLQITDNLDLLQDFLLRTFDCKLFSKNISLLYIDT